MGILSENHCFATETASRLYGICTVVRHDSHDSLYEIGYDRRT